jgi:hypothetical protein
MRKRKQDLVGWGRMQVAAMLAMLIDHIGDVFFSDRPAYRMIGRIAFPLYAYGIVLGYRYTSNFNRYVRRLSVLALVSQLPYMLLFRTYGLNAIFTLMVSLLAIRFIDRTEKPARKWGVFAAAVAVAAIVPMDYGWYGVALACIYRYLERHRLVLAHLILNGIDGVLTDTYMQHFSILPSIFIAYVPAWLTKGGRVVPDWMWRSFYPAHLLILFVILVWID